MVRDFDFPENEHFRNKNSVLCVLRNAKSKKKKKINTEFCSKKKVKTQLFIFTLVPIFKIQNKKLKKKIQIHRFDFYSSSLVTYENIFTKRVIKLRQVIYRSCAGNLSK